MAVSVFPVGLVGTLGLSSPVRLNGAVSTFYDSFYSGRTFRLDMAGFAVNLEYFRYIHNPHDHQCKYSKIRNPLVAERVVF